MILLFSRRLCRCNCLCICLCLCICVPYSFLNSYYHKLSENIWVWGSRGSRSGDLVRCYHSGTTDRPKRKDRATQPLDHGKLRWAKRWWHKKIIEIEKYLPFVSLRGFGWTRSITWCTHWQAGPLSIIFIVIITIIIFNIMVVTAIIITRPSGPIQVQVIFLDLSPPILNL